MGGIESVSFFHFWPAIGCFVISDLLMKVHFEYYWKYIPKFFYQLIYFVAIGLMAVTVVLLIIKLIKKGASALKELQEPDKFLEIFLVFVGMNAIGGIDNKWHEKCGARNVFYWIHCVLCFLLIAYGLYLWLGEGKNFAVPELMILSLLTWHYGWCSINNDAIGDTTKFYDAVGTMAFFIFFVVMFFAIKEQKMDPIIGISYVMILLYTGKFRITFEWDLHNIGADYRLNAVALYAAFLLWCLLLGLTIAGLIKCDWDFKKLMLSISALSGIGYMWQNCIPLENAAKDFWEYDRSVYGILTLIGLYFSFVCAFLLVIVYVMTLIKGDSKK